MPSLDTLMGVGMPATIYLQQFGEHLRAAFGQMPYHVGSSLDNKDGWRDVDVRIMLPDAEYEAQGFGAVSGYPANAHDNQKWVSTVLAWSAFGKALTGLPIDFQLQPISWANANEGRSRSALMDMARVHTDHEMGDSIRTGERERVAALIRTGRHTSDEELPQFVEPDESCFF